VAIDQPGVIVNSRTLAPLRFVGEAFGGIVDWDGETQTVTITSSGGEAATLHPEPTPAPESTPAPATTPTPLPQASGDITLVGRWLSFDKHNNFDSVLFFDEDSTFFIVLLRQEFLLSSKKIIIYHNNYAYL